MRLRHFRPAFDRLDVRITPSDVMPAPTSTASPDPNFSDSTYSSPTGNDPALTPGSTGDTIYASGSGSGYNPLCPTSSGASQ